MSEVANESLPDIHRDVYSKTVFGFWVFLITDFMLFATYFAVYVVLGKNTFDGPPASEILSPTTAMIQTLLLIACSFTSGMGGAFAHRKNKKGAIALFFVTFALGILFFGVQLHDFMRLYETGNGLQRSAFTTSYFNLVGLHTIHLVFGILWVLVLVIPVCKDGVSPVNLKRLTCLRMFWQYLTVIWVFIYSIVYLSGVQL